MKTQGDVVGDRDPKDMKTAELVRELRAALSLSCRALERAAALYVELRRRPDAPAPMLRCGLEDVLPLIADKTLAPEAVVAFSTKHRMLLDKVQRMPLPEQRKLAKEGATVAIADQDEKGVIKEVHRPIIQLNAAQLERAIDENRGAIRSYDEQMKMLRAQANAAATGDVPKPRLQWDSFGRRLRVGRALYTEQEVADLLRVVDLKVVEKALSRRDPPVFITYRKARVGAPEPA